MIRCKFLKYIFVCLFVLSFGGTLASAEDLFVVSRDNGKVLLFDSADSGLITPQRDITGGTTTLTSGSIYGILFYNDEVYVTDENTDAINVFSSTDDGNVAPKRQIAGGLTGFNSPRGLFISGSELFVADELDKSIKVFNTSDSGNVAPTRTISGGNTGFNSPCAVVVYGREIYVVDAVLNLISVFNLSDTGDVAPKRSFSVSGGMSNARGLWVTDGIVYVSDGNADRIMSFPATATGATTPSTTITGGTTTLEDPYGLIVKDGYIYASNFDAGIGSVTVFKVTDDGNVVPQRTITSGSLDGPVGIAMVVGGFVEKSEHQQSGVTVTLTSTSENATTTAEIQAAYNTPAGFDLRAPMGIFEATVDSNGANGVFRFNSTSLNGTVSDVRLVKCFQTNGTSLAFGDYASVADPDTEGTWWLEDARDNYISSGTTLTHGTNYFVNYVVKDNGKYDENPTLGEIKDPAALGVYFSDTGVGCVLNPVAGFGLEWALLIGSVGLAFIRRRMK